MTFTRICLGLLLAGVALIATASYLANKREDLVVSKARRMPIEAIGLSIVELNRMKAECESTLPRDQECVALIEFVPTKDRGQYDSVPRAD